MKKIRIAIIVLIIVATGIIFLFSMGGKEEENPGSIDASRMVEEVNTNGEWPRSGNLPPLDYPSSALISQAPVVSHESSSQPDVSSTNVPVSAERRSVWISYLNLDVTGLKKKDFTAKIEGMFKNIKNFGFNTVTVHVTPFADALYQSSYLPWSHVLTGKQGANPGYDPLQIMTKTAHALGLKIEAWVNPFRIQLNIDSGKVPKELSASAKKWTDQGLTIATASGLYFNPGVANARALIINSIAEIVKKYDVDGVHFDDYFYPEDIGKADAVQYEAYKKNKGTLTIENWRKDNVNQLVKGSYAAIKKAKAACLFGISPEGNIERSTAKRYADIHTWISNEGYIDYICPQIYYGYNNQTMPFGAVAEHWNTIMANSKVKLYFGLAAYKTGEEDKYAGTGSKEWQNNHTILSRQVQDARKLSHYDGIAIFDYNAIFGNNPSDIRKEEMNALKKVFQ